MGKGSEHAVLQRKHASVCKNVNRCSTSLAIRERQIKTTRYFTSTRMATVKKMDDSKRCPGSWEIWALVHHRMCRLWKRVWRFLKKVNIELPNDPAVPLPGTPLRDLETQVRTQDLHMNTHSRIICSIHWVVTAHTPVDRQMDETCLSTR